MCDVEEMRADHHVIAHTKASIHKPLAVLTRLRANEMKVRRKAETFNASPAEAAIGEGP